MNLYPDSVRRVRPPNTTIPKTLAALPNSQYATTFWLVLGKKRLLAFAPFPSVDPPIDGIGVDCGSLVVVVLDTAAVLRKRLELKNLMDFGDAFGNT